MACEYCVGKPTSDGVTCVRAALMSRYDSDRELWASVEGGELLVMYVPKDSEAMTDCLRINYCPMCGEDLRGGE